MTDFFDRYLEEQHPLIRGNIRMALVAIAILVGFHLFTYIGARQLELDFMFQSLFYLSLLQTLLYLLMFLMSLNLLRTLYLLIRQHPILSLAALGQGVLAVVVVAGCIALLPSFHARMIGAYSTAGYGDTYDQIVSLCEGWADEWGEAENIGEFIPTDYDLGVLGTEVSVARVNRTVIFDFGKQAQEFGIACVLDGGEPPETGRANGYQYSLIEANRYHFHESVR